MNRRRFLIRSGWIAAGITATAIVSFPVVRAALPALPTTGDPDPGDGFAWVQALPDGRIRFFCPRMEMGQGAGLGLVQVVAEELRVDQSAIECVAPDTRQTPPFKMTVGSESIYAFFEPVSTGAARLREALHERAARVAALPARAVKHVRGGFVLPDGRLLEYGDLVPDAPLILGSPGDTGSGPERYAMRPRSAHKVIGKAWRHHDLHAIVTGRMTFSRDVEIAGMLFGDVLRPPAFGAVLKSVDMQRAKTMPGIVATIADIGSGFAGIVAEDPFALREAMDTVSAEWEMPKAFSQADAEHALDVDRLRADDDFEHELAQDGALADGVRSAAGSIDARYDTAFAAHAAMEPRAATAHVRDEGVDVWCATQDPFFTQKLVAKALGRDASDVVVHSHRMGGAFGGRVICAASIEAARLSAAVRRPVKVQWDRETEFRHSYYQPAYAHRIEAGVTTDGRISHWDHDFASSPILTGQVPGNIAWALDLAVADSGTSRGALPHYNMANRRVRFSDIRTPVPIGAWRGLGAAPNTFAIESMIDELAHAAALDPLAFRLRNAADSSPRLKGVLRKVADMCDWGADLADHSGRGIACAVYKDQTYVSVVAEVAVDHTARSLRISRVWCAQDCGLVVNPDQVENLVMGNIAWGCSMALSERLTFEDGQTAEDNFHTYEILRNGDCPDIEVALVAPEGAPPVGVGESALGPVAPAIANAVFAATGQRVRSLPISYDSVFSA